MATIYETFWDHVDKSGGPTACWPWTRARVPKQSRARGNAPRGGYGSLAVPGKLNQQGSHRVAYELSKGPIPPGAVVRHTCDNPPCCNPEHLVIGTHADNRRDCISRRRVGDTRPLAPVHGEDQHAAKFTDETVYRMRQERFAGASWPELADKYGVSTSTVQAAGKGKTWKHVPMPDGTHPDLSSTDRRRGKHLTRDDVVMIKQLQREGLGPRAVSERLGLPLIPVRMVHYGKSWKYVS